MATLEFLNSRPLIPETDQTHLQRVLSEVARGLDGLHDRVAGLERQAAKAAAAADEQAEQMGTFDRQLKGLDAALASAKHAQDERAQQLARRQQEAGAEIREKLEELRAVFDQKNRGQDEVRELISGQLDAIQREYDARSAAVDEAITDLATRVDGKQDEAAHADAYFALEEAVHRGNQDLEAMRESAHVQREAHQKLAFDLEQFRLSQHTHDRDIGSQIIRIEQQLEVGLQKAQEMASVVDLRKTVHEQAKKLDTVCVTSTDALRRSDDSMQLIHDVQKRVLESLTDRTRQADAVARLRKDHERLEDAVEKMDGDVRSRVDRLRDDTDCKLLELLNAVQGVEQSKAVLERQVAEAGRILCSATMMPAASDAASDAKLPRLRDMAPFRRQNSSQSQESGNGGGGVELQNPASTESSKQILCTYIPVPDCKLLELLNAVQGVEQVLERQVAEAGRILCSATMMPAASDAASDAKLPRLRDMAPFRRQNSSQSQESGNGGGGVELQNPASTER
ncbi:hypothetical protein DIPPA_17765 [Diplonema papillatum]|nr:hypothetical protein DIPPA_17765 [Diplonema papillatum]